MNEQMRRRRTIRGFTLVELVMVVMIISMLSSMAIPRLSRGSTSAANASLAGTLRTVRTAILLYSAEHQGRFPGPSKARAREQFLTYSNMAGQTSPTKSSSASYGPYLQTIPGVPIGPNKGSTGLLIDSTNSPPQTNTASGDGWVYNPNTGEFFANVPGVVQFGVTLIENAVGATAEDD